MFLILSTPSMDYADKVSRELWLLVRPRLISSGETSMYYTGRYSHSDGNRVAIGPIDGSQPIHEGANPKDLLLLIGQAITDDESSAAFNAITNARGGRISILELISSMESLSENLRTREQMESDGWFKEDILS